MHTSTKKSKDDEMKWHQKALSNINREPQLLKGPKRSFVVVVFASVKSASKRENVVTHSFDVQNVYLF